jgi:hypothetical protein
MKKLIDILIKFVIDWVLLFLVCGFVYWLFGYLIGQLTGGVEIALPPVRAMIIIIALITLISLIIASSDE